MTAQERDVEARNTFTDKEGNVQLACIRCKTPMRFKRRTVSARGDWYVHECPNPSCRMASFRTKQYPYAEKPAQEGEDMSEEQKLRWHYTPTRKAHIMQMGGLVTGRYSDMTPNAPIQVARSKEAETTIQHHMVYMDPMEHVQELWEDLQQKLIAFQRSNCVTFVGKLVLRAETENHLVYFWLEAQIHARVKNFGYDELLKNEKRESLPKSWSEEDFLEKYGVQFALPQDIPVRNV